MLNRRDAFSLIEIMVAIMMLSIVLVTLSSSEGLVLNSSRKAKLTTLAVLAAKNLMSDIDINYQVQGFDYINNLAKKEEKDFTEPEYAGWRWVREVREVEFPIGELLKMATEQSKEEEENASASQADAFIGLLGTNIDKIMKETVREVSITVFWPLRGGSSFANYSMVYYVVDYDKASVFTPTM